MLALLKKKNVIHVFIFSSRVGKIARIVPCANSISVTPAAWVHQVTLLTPYE